MHVSNTIEQFEEFFKCYQTFTLTHDNVRFKEFKTGFIYLKSALESLGSLSKEIDRQVADNFNIFDVLGVGHYEVKTHSALLADLLDPNGSHAQGDLFLKNFIDIIDIKNKPNAIEIKNGYWEVEKEKVTPNGNIDIIIYEANLKHAILIENKIYAADQKDQLKRYHNWIEKSRFKRNGILVYLTIDGRPSNEAENDRVPYQKISYKFDIKNWLYKSRDFVIAYRIKDTITQYIKLIEKL